MSDHEFVILQYEDITPQNWLLLKEAAEQRNVRLESWQPHKITIFFSNGQIYALYNSTEIVPKVILHRTIFPFAGILQPALNYWSKLGTVVINQADAAFNSRDKLLTTLLLSNAGIPVVDTVGFIETTKDTFTKLRDKKVIVKPAFGIQGEGIKLFESKIKAYEELSKNKFNANLYRQDHYIAQSFIETNGEDLRAFVVNNKCVALMQRKAKKGEFRANLANGAVGSALPLTHPASRIATEALRACKLDYGGVDMIEDKDDTIRVLEVDAWAGFAGISRVTGVDVAGTILDMVIDRLKKGKK